MSTVGQIEKRTQARVVALFRKRLNYDYLGDRTDFDNRNIEPDLLRTWLAKQGVSDTLINRALHELNKAATDSEGLRYATIETSEKYYLRWVEDSGPYAAEPNRLDRELLQVCAKARLLELIHDFVVFDAGAKKLCRQNQYFGVKAAQDFIRRREGGIIWHTQGSGKSLIMVWLAKWIRENREGARVLIITDRTELDEQIEKVFLGVNEQIYRTTSGADLIDKLNHTEESLLCSLVHKFGRPGNNEAEGDEGTKAFIEALQKLPPDFRAKGDIHVFVDECHRTQSGDLHDAMKKVLPNAIFIGFTGTPLLKADKKRSIEVFGRYIHTYKFDQAVREGVVLDLRYEARDIDQSITSQKKIDEWFDAKTKGLNDLAKAQLKQKWGTMQRVLSSQSRLEKIVADILLDMNQKPRLMDGHGNAMLVAAPLVVSDEAVRLAVIDKLGWIKRQKTSFAEQPRQSQREMVNGESHYFLGRRYRLRVHEQDGPARVAVRGIAALDIFVRRGTSAQKCEELLLSWYREQLKMMTPPLLKKWQSKLGVKATAWGIKKMKTKWGSCNVDSGRVWFNLELAKKPPQCLEYMVVHELVHLVERHHNDRFTALMQGAMPQWRQFRKLLNAAPLGHEAWNY